jgi:PTH1 family peptidyl-tRNA hydrolase
MLWGPVAINGRDVAMMKPTTYMNRSGSALKDLPEGFIRDASEVLVVYDDVAIPFGRMRLRKKGSAGGHNGMLSILAALGTLEVPRLRIGIGSDTEHLELSEFVLSEFTEEEKEKLPMLFDKGIEVINCVVNGDWDKGMQIANSFALNA